MPSLFARLRLFQPAAEPAPSPPPAPTESRPPHAPSAFAARMADDPDAAGDELLAAYKQHGYNGRAVARAYGVSYRTLMAWGEALGIRTAIRRARGDFRGIGRTCPYGTRGHSGSRPEPPTPRERRSREAPAPTPTEPAREGASWLVDDVVRRMLGGKP